MECNPFLRTKHNLKPETHGASKGSKSSSSSNIISDVNQQQPSLRERLSRFEIAQKKKDFVQFTEAGSLKCDPTTIFFRSLKRLASANGDATLQQPKRLRQPYDQDTSSSPVIIAKDDIQHQQMKIPVVEAIEATYAGKADELERVTNAKLIQAREILRKQIKDLKKQEGCFIEELKAQRQLVAKPLFDLELESGSQTKMSLGRILVDFRAEKKAVENAVLGLWNEWDNLNDQIRQLCQRIIAGENSHHEDVDDQVQAVLDAATKELVQLDSNADKAINKAQKEAEKQRQQVRELWIEQKAREYDTTHVKTLKLR